MIREKLIQEYRHLVNQAYPYIGCLLNDCYITILDGCLNQVAYPYHYLGIYYSGIGAREIIAYQKELKELAKTLGMIEIVFINAKPLLRDPLSRLKQDNPRLWLELYWIVARVETNLD